MAENKYFKIGEAIDDIGYASGAKDKTIASLKLFGKGVFNIGKFAATEIFPAALETAARSVEKNQNATEDQKRKAEELKAYAKTIKSDKNNYVAIFQTAL